MKTLVICRPREGVDSEAEIAPRAGEIVAALRRLRDDGLLLEVYSPGGHGVVLIFDGGRAGAEAALESFLLLGTAIDAEFTELHPFAALTE